MRLIVALAAGLAGTMLSGFVDARSDASPVGGPAFERDYRSYSDDLHDRTKLAQAFDDDPFYDRDDDQEEWLRHDDRVREQAERRREEHFRREEQRRNRQLDRRNRELDQRNRELDEQNSEIAPRQRERSDRQERRDRGTLQLGGPAGTYGPGFRNGGVIYPHRDND